MRGSVGRRTRCRAVPCTGLPFPLIDFAPGEQVQLEQSMPYACTTISGAQASPGLENTERTGIMPARVDSGGVDVLSCRMDEDANMTAGPQRLVDRMPSADELCSLKRLTAVCVESGLEPNPRAKKKNALIPEAKGQGPSTQQAWARHFVETLQRHLGTMSRPNRKNKLTDRDAYVCTHQHN